MSTQRTRLVRRGLLIVVAVVAAAVAWSLLRPSAQQTAPAVRPPAARGEGATASDVVFLRFREGEQQIEVRARAQVGQEGSKLRLLGCEVKKPFVSEGRPATSTVSADECDYTPQPQTAKLRGHVKVTTSDDFELDTEQLDYLADKGVVRGEGDVRFRRRGSSGTARGFRYRSEAGELQLASQVRLTLEQSQGPPAEVEAGSLRAIRPERRIFLDGGVVVRQGARELRAQKLQINMTGDFRSAERVNAIEDVELRVFGSALPGGSVKGTGGGEKHLRCRKLGIDLHDGVLYQADAINPAVLEMSPGSKDPPERRRLATELIHFAFDVQGRLVSIDARGKEAKSRGTVLTSEPLPGTKGAPRRVECLKMAASVDPESGAVTKARFEQDVVFVEPGRKAWARQAELQDADGLLTLSGEPRVLDEAQGSDLRARQIAIGTRTHAVSATGDVRHTITRKGKSLTPMPVQSEEPTVLVCRKLDVDGGAKTARYQDNAVLRSGGDEIRASLIVIEEPAEGRRRLSASGGVVSTLHPKTRKGEKHAAEPVLTRSREMVYDEKGRRVVYTGDVELRQGDILTKSPEATLLLSADGTEMERLDAGSPAEVRQGTRRATGERATYTPRDETLVLVGEKVVAQDADRRLEGRVLTFQSGSDRIRVDGREEVRSEAVLKRKEPLKP